MISSPNSGIAMNFQRDNGIEPHKRAIAFLKKNAAPSISVVEAAGESSIF